MTDQHMARAEALAGKIASKVEDALAPLEREMTLMKWPDEFRAIVWEAVARGATSRAVDLNTGAKEGR